MNVERHSLRRLVVETETGRFLTTLGEWTYNESEAMAFDDISSMLSKCATFHVADARILLRFQSDERFDVQLPLPEEKNLGHQRHLASPLISGTDPPHSLAPFSR